MGAISLFPRNCPLCSSQDKKNIFAPANFDATQWEQYSFSSRKLPENAHFRLILCDECSLLYADPIPSQDELHKSYADSGFDSGREAHYASLTYADLLAPFLKKLPDLNHSLDVGTGEGSFLERLLEMGFKNVTGIEPSRAPIESAKENIRALIRPGLFRADDFSPSSFSLITCFQTFEHLHDPLTVCQDFYKLIKPGGGVFLIFHNRVALSAKLMGLKSPIYDIEHMQLFSHQSAAYLLKKCGFKNIEFRTVYNRYPLAYWARLFPFPKKIKSNVLDFLNRNDLGKILISIPAGNFAAFAVK